MTAVQGAFIDRRGVEWHRVRRVEHALHQTFTYRYPGPIKDLKHELMVTPRDDYGGQVLGTSDVSVTPPLTVAARQDGFGNTVLSVAADEVEGTLEFTLFSTVGRTLKAPPTLLSAADAGRFYDETRLTETDAKMQGVARELRGTYTGALAFAARLNEWVHGALRYGFGATDTRTPAASALAGGVGLCQDYAHVMVAMCRAAGVAARYVSGHMLGEGGSHAWVEVLLPEGDGFAAYAFDPTNRRRPGLDYLTVAVGRDYSDVPPTAGSFNAPYGGELSCTKRAGLTRVEYHGGEVLEVGGP